MKLSLIICTYNINGRLEKTLDSLLDQTYDDFEVIVIDGASTDGTVDVVKAYEEKFAGKLWWASEKDSGIYNAMNKGVRMALGAYLSVVGAGDWLEKDVLQEIARCISENPQADAIYGKTRIWNGDMENSEVVQTSPEILPTQPMQHPAIYYKKELHSEFGLYDESYAIAADYLFCLKAFYFGKAVVKMIDAITNNFVMDGMSSNNAKECEAENKRLRKELGIKTSIKISNLIKIIKKRLRFLK
ncbi:MAG: Glycosyltransferase [Candidatus Moranbacteria bacterium GW2011_GWA2_39_41]|nr:MAG: Glycosyltransferase [Candidatus Moranbacteria bacterium GW2011_GWA2_39_41]